jgi:SAM-dependent methyltransferase
MGLDERFDELAENLGGFYRSWHAYLGIELGLFDRIRAAGSGGLTPAELAAATGTQLEPVDAWIRGADAGGLVELDGERVRLDDDVASILLDDDRPEYLGGQFVATVVSSMDYEGLTDFFRTGRSVPERPPRFHRAIEAVTVQDIAVFFQEGLAALPELAADLAVGGRVLDVACGGGRWLIAMARRFPAIELVGVEDVPDNVARAVRHVSEAGLDERIRILARDTADLPYPASFDLVYYQDALHELGEPVASLRAAWATVRPAGRLLVLDWCLPDSPDESRTLQGELHWGVQIDELFQGTRMYTRAGFERIFVEAGVPRPQIIDLRSGASLFLAVRD